MFSLNRVNALNPSIISNIADKNTPNNINKNNKSSNSLRDEYVSSAKADLISGVYSKETEKGTGVVKRGEFSQEEYEEYCTVVYVGVLDEGRCW